MDLLQDNGFENTAPRRPALIEAIVNPFPPPFSSILLYPGITWRFAKQRQNVHEAYYGGSCIEEPPVLPLTSYRIGDVRGWYFSYQPFLSPPGLVVLIQNMAGLPINRWEPFSVKIGNVGLPWAHFCTDWCKIAKSYCESAASLIWQSEAFSIH